MSFFEEIKTITVKLSPERLETCIRNAENGKGWVSTEKRGVWGAGKGNYNNIDIATLMGCKGEHAVVQYANQFLRNFYNTTNSLEIHNERTTSPDVTCDLNEFPIPGKKTEIKTHNFRLGVGLIRAQVWNNSLSRYVWVSEKKSKIVLKEKNCEKLPSTPEHSKGLMSDFYIFCQASASPTDNIVTISGWITRQEILEHWGNLHDAKRKNRNGFSEWKNYEIPLYSLKPIEDLFKISVVES